jgi:hypothetical protein
VSNALQTAAAAFISGRNRIINGDGRVNQRGNMTGAVNTSSYGGPDRWLCQVGNSAGAAFNQVQGSFTVNGYAHTDIAQQVTTAATNLSGSAYISGFCQVIEGLNAFDLVGAPITISFWVYATVAGVYNLSISDGNASQSFVAQFTVAAATTPQYVSITVPSLPANLTVPKDTTAGLIVRIGALNTGTYQRASGSVGVWAAGNHISAPGAVSWASTVGNILAVTMVQLEAGPIATLFDRRSYGQELALCQRYYQSIFIGTTNGAITAAGQTIGCAATFQVPMRATPTAILGNETVANAVAAGAATYSVSSNGLNAYKNSTAASGNCAFYQWVNLHAEL